jgi:hypothetical protein
MELSCQLCALALFSLQKGVPPSSAECSYRERSVTHIAGITSQLYPILTYFTATVVSKIHTNVHIYDTF